MQHARIGQTKLYVYEKTCGVCDFSQPVKVEGHLEKILITFLALSALLLYH